MLDARCQMPGEELPISRAACGSATTSPSPPSSCTPLTIRSVFVSSLLHIAAAGGCCAVLSPLHLALLVHLRGPPPRHQQHRDLTRTCTRARSRAGSALTLTRTCLYSSMIQMYLVEACGHVRHYLREADRMNSEMRLFFGHADRVL